MTPRRWAVRVPATTANLGPGFDALGAALSSHLVVGAVPRGDVRVTTRGEGAGDVPTGEDNLVWRSLVRFCEHVGADAPDVSLLVDNAIPLERGLGSSSAAIVAGLVLGRALVDAPIGDRELVAVATEVEGHPDNVAPAILGGFVACTSAADGHLVIRRAQPPARLAVLSAVPADRQNTEAARRTLPESLARGDVATQAGRAAHVAGALVGAWPMDVGASGDLLHEPVRLRAMSDSGALVEALRGAGVHAWLSGAGPSVAATVPRADAALGERVVALARAHGFDGRLLDWDLSGAIACPDGGCAVSGLGGCHGCPRQRLW